MRTAILATAALAVVEVMPRPAAAAIYYPWCAAYYIGQGGARSCAFLTRDQCMASLGGIGGYCYENPKPPSVYQGSAVPPQQPQQRRPTR
jgi:Protein of unknown function (DUF3551)